MTQPPQTFTDADAALLYDVENTWDRVGWPADRFYSDAVAAAESVLDVGCGTGGMLHGARDEGHSGRLVGVDPDEAMLALARRRSDIEWVLATAAEMTYDTEFDLAVMASNAFQCFAADEELRASLVAVRRALRPGGTFVFGTRHLQARAWESWNPPRTLNPALVEAGFRVESQYGDRHRGPVTGDSRGIITVARAQ